MAIKLTKPVIEGAKPKTDAQGNPKITYLFDSEKEGLILKITPTGAKSFHYQARVGTGRHAKKTRRLIGTWPACTLEAARKAAEKWHSRVRVAGEDPAAERVKEREQQTKAAADKRTVNDGCDAYLEAAKTMPTRRGTVKSEKNLDIDRGRINAHIRPLLGTKILSKLTKGDITSFRDKIAAGETKRVIKSKKKRGKHVIKGGQGTANRCLNLLGGILSYCVDQGWIASNPVSKVVKFYRPNVGKRASSEMLKLIGGELRKMESDSPAAASILRALALTGFRYKEVAGLLRSWVELSGALVRLPYLDNKVQRERILVLGRPAIDVLAGQPRIRNNPYMFPSDRTKRHFTGTSKHWKKVQAALQKEFGVSFRPHDFRHTFTTIGMELGYPKPVIGALLGSAKQDTMDTYIHVAPEAMRAAADAISGAVARLLDGNTAQVMQMPQGGTRLGAARTTQMGQ